MYFRVRQTVLNYFLFSFQTAVCPVHQDRLVHLAKTVRLVTLVRLGNQVSLEDRARFVQSQPLRHVDLARQGPRDQPGPKDHQETPEATGTPVDLVTMEILASQDLPDLRATPDLPDPMDPKANLVRLPQALQPFLETLVHKVTLDPTALPDLPDRMVPTVSQEAQDLKDHPETQEPMVILVKTVPTALLVPQDLPEKRESVRNIALWTVVSFSRMVPDDDQTWLSTRQARQGFLQPKTCHSTLFPLVLYLCTGVSISVVSTSQKSIRIFCACDVECTFCCKKLDLRLGNRCCFIVNVYFSQYA